MILLSDFHWLVFGLRRMNVPVVFCLFTVLGLAIWFSSLLSSELLSLKGPQNTSFHQRSKCSILEITTHFEEDEAELISNEEKFQLGSW